MNMKPCMNDEPKIILKGGIELTPAEAADALWEAMQIIEVVGTTGIYSRYRQAEQWMKSYFPNWA